MKIKNLVQREENMSLDAECIKEYIVLKCVYVEKANSKYFHSKFIC